MTSTTLAWGSLHVYAPEPWEELLGDTLQPALRALRDSSLVSHAFFIRYWQGEPHLRIRVASGRGQATAEALRAIEGVLCSCRRLRVTRDVYTPETERFGGAQGMAQVHAHFDQSSTWVLERLAEAHSSPAHRRAQAAFMHLSLALTQGSRARAAKLLAHFAARWFAPSSWPRWKARFDAALEAQQAGSFAALRQLVSAPIETGPGGSAQAAFRAHVTRFHRGLAGSVGKSSLESVLHDCAHLNNNRLGVRHPDEAYLAYALARALWAHEAAEERCDTNS